MKLGKTVVQDFEAPYIIAEIGSNHNGDMDLARRMIDAAHSCGCQAVKFQSWTPQSLIAKEEYDRNQTYNDSPKKHFGSLREMVEKYYLRPAQHVTLKRHCDGLGIEFLSTPFSFEEVDLLEGLDVPFYKIASMDINNLLLLQYAARKGKPVVLSTGMATLEEVEQAVRTLEETGNKQILLLHCVSIYPPPWLDINLNNIPMLRKKFGYPVGFSDHTLGIEIALASVALGSCVIEKHFTTDKDLPGWDHAISADPKEMKALVEGAQNIAKALGTEKRIVSQAEREKRIKFRRSIVAKHDLAPGRPVALEDIVFKRPETGIAPDQVQKVVGKKTKRHIHEDEVISWQDLE
jgi:sialic acid synthase SpsE